MGAKVLENEPMVGTSPCELPASSGPMCAARVPMGWALTKGSASAGAGAVPCLRGDGDGRAPLGHLATHINASFVLQLVSLLPNTSY